MSPLISLSKQASNSSSLKKQKLLFLFIFEFCLEILVIFYLITQLSDNPIIRGKIRNRSTRELRSF
jgi:hypothetical protein